MRRVALAVAAACTLVSAMTTSMDTMSMCCVRACGGTARRRTIAAPARRRKTARRQGRICPCISICWAKSTPGAARNGTGVVQIESAVTARLRRTCAPACTSADAGTPCAPPPAPRRLCRWPSSRHAAGTKPNRHSLRDPSRTPGSPRAAASPPDRPPCTALPGLPHTRREAWRPPRSGQALRHRRPGCRRRRPPSRGRSR